MIYNEQPNNFIPDIEVVGCLVECDGKILLLHRHEYKSEGGKWGIPAGKIDKEDTSKESALTREIFEETGLRIKEEDLNFHRTFFVEYPNKKYFYHYHKTTLRGEAEITIEKNEHQDFIWVTPQEALTMPLITHEDHCLKDYFRIK